MANLNGDSEMEEGEIVDECDELSDISSEEEFNWLRERATLLESYNNVLERNKAKHSKKSGPKNARNDEKLWQELSQVNNTIPESPLKAKNKKTKNKKPEKHKSKVNEPRSVVNHQPKESYTKRKQLRKEKRKPTKRISETSDSSEDDGIINKKIKLANAVTIQKKKFDKTTLKERLMKMFSKSDTTLCSKGMPDKENAIAGLDVTKNYEHKTIAKTLDISGNLLNKDVTFSKNNKNLEYSKTVEDKTIVLNDVHECIELSDTSDDEPKKIELDKIIDVDSVEKSDEPEVKDIMTMDTDDDLETLRCHALKTKLDPTSAATTKNIESDDEDSDTKELRMICLKSAALKNAIEIKQKQKLQKLLNSSSVSEKVTNQNSPNEPVSNNNTDIESVDMDTEVSDNDNVFDDSLQHEAQRNALLEQLKNNKDLTIKSIGEDDDLDILRSKLLISMSSRISAPRLKKKFRTQMRRTSIGAKNTKNIINNAPKIVKNVSVHEVKENVQDFKALNTNQELPGRKKVRDKLEKNAVVLVKDKIENTIKTAKAISSNLKGQVLLNQSKTKSNVPVKEIKMQVNSMTNLPIGKNNNIVVDTLEKEDNPPKVDFIIITNDSDTGSETEATKNLTKMHNKLVPLDFQKQLDAFLKTTRNKVEKNLENNTVTAITPITPKVQETFVPKAVNHLPISAQQEYDDLVKRMAELEKLKKAREYMTNMKNSIALKDKDSLKPNNVSMDSKNLDEEITMSRKKIAEESSEVLKLKEEGKKLAQKQKILSTELLNLSTAIIINKKQTKLAQSKLAGCRTQHQLLLRRSSHIFPTSSYPYKKHNPVAGTQIEKEAIKPKNIVKNIPKDSDKIEQAAKSSVVETKVHSLVKTIEINVSAEERMKKLSILEVAHKDKNDYQSPLQAMITPTWDADPHGVLCPYDVGGVCKDSSCKYLHATPIQSLSTPISTLPSRSPYL